MLYNSIIKCMVLQKDTHPKHTLACAQVRSRWTEKVWFGFTSIIKFNDTLKYSWIKHWGTACSLCPWALVQTQIPPLHAVSHPLSKPNLTQHPNHRTKGSLLSQRAARSPSIFKLLGEEEEVQRMKVTRMKCSLGRVPKFQQLRQLSAAVIRLTIDEKWTNESGQPRVNIPWCLLSKLLTWVVFSLSVRACLRPVYASGEPSLTPVRDSGDNMPRFCL